MEWYPTGEMIGDFLTKPNRGSISNIFRDLIMRVMPQTNPSKGKEGNRKKIKLIKVSKSNKINGRRASYHKHTQECIADGRTDGDQNSIIIRT